MTKKDTIRRLLIMMMALIVPCISAISQITSSDLRLSGEIARTYDEGARLNYNVRNIEKGDSIYKIGIERGEINIELAGIILKALGELGSGNIQKAIEYYNEGIDVSENPKNLIKTHYYLRNMDVNLSMMQGDMYEMLKKAQKMTMMATGDEYGYGMCYSYMCMGLVYTIRDNPKLAEQYFSKAAAVAEKEDLDDLKRNIYVNLSNCYYSLNDKKKSAETIEKLTELAEDIDDENQRNITYTYMLATAFDTYSDAKFIAETEKAMENKSLYMVEREMRMLILSHYYTCKRVKKIALAYADSLSTGVNQLNTKEMIYKFFGDWKKAYDYRIAAVMVHDSIQTVIQNEDFAAMESEMGNNALRANQEKLEAKNRHVIYGSIITVILVLAALIGFYFKFKQKALEDQKTELETEVERQTSELREKNTLIERANRETTDSINYAQRIQNALLPDLKGLEGKGLKGTFTFMRPYNIVSGDFYWSKIVDDNIIVACADCTGHGVPGAFMSIIGSTLLSEICSQAKLPTAGEILTELDKLVLDILGQKKDEMIRDGMDVALVIYNPKTFTLTYSTARRPIYMVQDGSLTEYKCVKRSIGDKDEKSRQLEFVTETLRVFPGDTLYLCSDGIVDQFGGQEEYGADGKRLKTAGLKKMLNQISKLDIYKQGREVEKLFDEWKGTCVQVDDITMIGLKF